MGCAPCLRYPIREKPWVYYYYNNNYYFAGGAPPLSSSSAASAAARAASIVPNLPPGLAGQDQEKVRKINTKFLNKIYLLFFFKFIRIVSFKIADVIQDTS